MTIHDEQFKLSPKNDQANVVQRSVKETKPQPLTIHSAKSSTEQGNIEEEEKENKESINKWFKKKNEYSDNLIKNKKEE